MKVKNPAMAKKFTKKEIKKYLSNPSTCPRCDGDIRVEEDFSEESMSREIHCQNPDCGIEFHEVFDLVTIEIAE